MLRHDVLEKGAVVVEVGSGAFRADERH
jgi:hypothetical protein